MENQEDTFHYTYSAAQQAELEQIRRKYLPAEEDPMEQLRKLDRLPVQKAQSWSIAVGVIGALILGVGMSLCMSELGAALGYLSTTVGILVGLLGLSLVALAYPVYRRVFRKEQERITPVILRMTEDLMR